MLSLSKATETECRMVRTVGKGMGYEVSESEGGRCEEEVKWPEATGEKSNDTARSHRLYYVIEGQLRKRKLSTIHLSLCATFYIIFYIPP